MEVESLSNSNLLEPCVCTKRTQSDHNFFIEVDEDEDRMIDEDINDRAHPVGQLAKVHGPGDKLILIQVALAGYLVRIRRMSMLMMNMEMVDDQHLVWCGSMVVKVHVDKLLLIQVALARYLLINAQL